MEVALYANLVVLYSGWSADTLFASHLLWHSLLTVRFPCVHLVNNQVLLVAWARPRLCSLHFGAWSMILHVFVEHRSLPCERAQVCPSLIHFFIVVSDSLEIFSYLRGLIRHLFANNLLYTPRFLCSQLIFFIWRSFCPISLTHRIQSPMSPLVHFLNSFVHHGRCKPLMNHFESMTDYIVLLWQCPKTRQDRVVNVLEQQHFIKRINHTGLLDSAIKFSFQQLWLGDLSALRRRLCKHSMATNMLLVGGDKHRAMICWQYFWIPECLINGAIALTAMDRQLCSFKSLLSGILMECVAAHSNIAILKCSLLVLCKTTSQNVRPDLVRLDYQLVLCSIFQVGFIIECSLQVWLVGVWLGKIWKDPAVQTNVVLFQMVLLIGAVEEYAKPRKLLEPLCVPAWPSLSHVIEYVVDKGHSWLVHPLIRGLISFVLALDNANHLSIRLLLKDESICTDCYIVRLRWNFGLIWRVLHDAWWDMVSIQMILIIWGICCFVRNTLMSYFDAHSLSQRRDRLPWRGLGSWLTRRLFLFTHNTGSTKSGVSERTCSRNSCLFGPNTLAVCNSNRYFFSQHILVLQVRFLYDRVLIFSFLFWL